MKPALYQMQMPDGTLTEPLTARQFAQDVGLPLAVITKRLQRGERRVKVLTHPVRVYAGNNGYHAPTLDERREFERIQANEAYWIDKANTEAAEAETDI